MNASLKAKVSYSSGLSGCGNPTAGVAKDCSCGGAGCGICQSQLLVRPHFFAGQLLTEDDLRLLGDYVVAKNRLHNRFLFGEGVVCGLQVTCHPCGDGQVIVQPGYALDCCGNDLALACPQTLDINAMVRELRRKLLGADCGDPCADKHSSRAGSADKKTTTAQEQEKPSEPTRHYCLFIRYCEEMTDPVAPYSTGEPCGAQACVPTRVREGIRFELRCHEEERQPNTLLTRICQCLGDLDSTEKSARDSLYLHSAARQLKRALNEIKTNTIQPFDADHVEALKQATAKLDEALNKIGLPIKSVKLKELDQGEPKEVSEAALRTALDATLEAASLVARYYSRSTDDRNGLLKLHKNLPAIKTNAIKALKKAQILENSDLINKTLKMPLERETAKALIEIINAKLISEKLQLDDHEVRFLTERAVFTPRVLSVYMQSLDALREWLLDRLDKSPHLMDCELRQVIRQVILPVRPAQEAKGETTSVGISQARVGLSDAALFSTAAEKLLNVYTRYLRDCLCAALNPACQPCDDPAVLLACLEVKDCEVIRICNLERTFVLSPTSIRYWAPINLFGKVIEQLCCPVSECPDIRKEALIGERMQRLFAESPWSVGYPGSLPQSQKVFTSLLSGFLSKACRKDQKQLGRVLVPIVNLFQKTNYTWMLASQSAFFSAFDMLAPSVMEAQEERQDFE